MGASQLAGVLETKYCLVEGTEVDNGTFTSDGQSESNVSPSTVPEQMLPTPQSVVADTQEGG